MEGVRDPGIERILDTVLPEREHQRDDEQDVGQRCQAMSSGLDLGGCDERAERRLADKGAFFRVNALHRAERNRRKALCEERGISLYQRRYPIQPRVNRVPLW